MDIRQPHSAKTFEAIDAWPGSREVVVAIRSPFWQISGGGDGDRGEGRFVMAADANKFLIACRPSPRSPSSDGRPRGQVSAATRSSQRLEASTWTVGSTENFEERRAHRITSATKEFSNNLDGIPSPSFLIIKGRTAMPLPDVKSILFSLTPQAFRPPSPRAILPPLPGGASPSTPTLS